MVEGRGCDLVRRGVGKGSQRSLFGLLLLILCMSDGVDCFVLGTAKIQTGR